METTSRTVNKLMETASMYEENTAMNGSVKQLNNDFKYKNKTGLLSSPDSNIMLCSPVPVTATQDPTQHLFLTAVTQEQEDFGQGFLAALEKIHNQEKTNEETPNPADTSSTMTTLQPVPLPSPSPALMHQQPQQSTRVLQLKEPQTVPCNSAPPISPINMESQERIKADRKKAKNRFAARKCRFKKLDKIARLEDRVKELKGKNKDLRSIASQLRQEVAALDQPIMQHINAGCAVTMPASVLGLLFTMPDALQNRVKSAIHLDHVEQE